MEKEEIACVEQFANEMKKFGYELSLRVKDKPMLFVKPEVSEVEVELLAYKKKPKGDTLFSQILTRFSL